MDKKCPMCGTSGKMWHEDPAVFKCPNCFSIYSHYGVVMESEKEFLNIWS